MTIKSLPGLIVLLSLLGGCGVYTNIPSQKGDVATHDPNPKIVQALTVPALRAVVNDQPIDGQYTVVLPPRTLPATYDLLLPKIGPNAVWSSDGAPPVGPVVEVRQIRVRGSEAEVDVVRPSNGGAADGPPVLVTAHLDWDPFSNWHVTKLRIWRAGVGQAIGSGASE